MSFEFGSFIYTYENDIGKLVANQIRICRSTEFYNAVSKICEPCDENKGTTEFQQLRCKSCGDMWFNTSTLSDDEGL